MIRINEFERSIEFRLGPTSRRLLRAVVALLTNAALCLMVIAATRVFQILVDYLYGANSNFLGVPLLKYAVVGMYYADILIVALFAISTLIVILRLARDPG